MIDETKILQLLRTGADDKALSVLYRHLPAIRRMIRYHGGSRQQAEDIFQEALIIFCRKAQEPRFVLVSGIYPYLYRICRFLWNDECKREKKNGRLIPVDDAVEMTAPEPAINTEEEARYRLAETIISGLGDRCKELLLLFYTGGIRLKEIAEAHGLQQ